VRPINSNINHLTIIFGWDTATGVEKEGQKRRIVWGGNQEGRQQWGISRLFGAAKLQSAPGADNPRYASERSKVHLSLDHPGHPFQLW